MVEWYSLASTYRVYLKALRAHGNPAIRIHNRRCDKSEARGICVLWCWTRKTMIVNAGTKGPSGGGVEASAPIPQNLASGFISLIKRRGKKT